MTSKAITGGSAVLGNALAATLDKKRGEAADVAVYGDGEIPINITAGPALVLASLFFPTGAAQDVVGGFGFGVTMAGVYRATYDRVPE